MFSACIFVTSNNKISLHIILLYKIVALIYYKTVEVFGKRSLPCVELLFFSTSLRFLENNKNIYIFCELSRHSFLVTHFIMDKQPRRDSAKKDVNRGFRLDPTI